MSAVEMPVAGDVPYVSAAGDSPYVPAVWDSPLMAAPPLEGWSNTACSVFYGYGVPSLYVSQGSLHAHLRA